jgi:RHS-family protein
MEGKGGTIKVSDDGKNWEYTDWEGNTVKYKDGYPDFSPYERQHVDIEMKGNRTSDFTEANNKAPKGKNFQRILGITMKMVLLCKRFRQIYIGDLRIVVEFLF